MNKMCRTNTQSGRSMIEMLGVLAIVGVLSIGGIAGYSKAMMKFKINKTIEQISQISANIRALYIKQRNYASLGNYINMNYKLLKKANLVPLEIFEGGSGSSETMINAFGGIFRVNADGKFTHDDNKAFIVGVEGIPEEACIELATQDWGAGSDRGLIAVAVDHATAQVWGYSNNCQGGLSAYHAEACNGGSGTSIPMPVDVAVEGCDCTYGLCSFAVKYY